MLCVALITQKSRSPHMTSRISSPSGRTTIVVYRSRVCSGITPRSDAGTSRTPVCPVTESTTPGHTKTAAVSVNVRRPHHRIAHLPHSGRGHEPVQTRLEAVFPEHRGNPLVVDRSV